MKLYSLTYMSSAVHVPTPAEIDHLLERARLRNLKEEVTGVLLYADGSFLQCIEGPEEGLERVYAAILADPLHHNVLELLHDPIDEREFTDWTMAYRAVGRTTVDLDEALTAKLSAPPGTLSATRHLLAAFWNGGLGSRYAAVISGEKSTLRHSDASED